MNKVLVNNFYNESVFSLIENMCKQNEIPFVKEYSDSPEMIVKRAKTAEYLKLNHSPNTIPQFNSDFFNACRQYYINFQKIKKSNSIDLKRFIALHKANALGMAHSANDFIKNAESHGQLFCGEENERVALINMLEGMIEALSQLEGAYLYETEEYKYLENDKVVESKEYKSTAARLIICLLNLIPLSTSYKEESQEFYTLFVNVSKASDNLAKLIISGHIVAKLSEILNTAKGEKYSKQIVDILTQMLQLCYKSVITSSKTDVSISKLIEIPTEDLNELISNEQLLTTLIKSSSSKVYVTMLQSASLNNEKASQLILKVICDINMAEPKSSKQAFKILRGIARLNDQYAQFRMLYVFTIHQYKGATTCDWLNSNSSKDEYRDKLLRFIKILIKASYSMCKYITENSKVPASLDICMGR